MLPRAAPLFLAFTILLAGCVTLEGETANPASPGAPSGGTQAPGTTGVLHTAFGDPLSEAEAGVASQGSTSGGATGALRIATFESFEPTLGVDASGRIFLVALDNKPINIPSDLGFHRTVQRSDDDGLTWTDVSPKAGVGNVKVRPHAQTNDPYVHVDPLTGRVFVSDLQVLMCSILSFSDDAGATWTTNPVGCGHPVGDHDHQTIWTAKKRRVLPGDDPYPSILYYCVNHALQTSCATSRDGGLTFGPLRPAVFETGNSFGCITGGLTGHGVSDSQGRAYIAKPYCDGVRVAWTQDDGIIWQSNRASPEAISNHDVELAFDASDNMYVLYQNDQGELRLVVRPAGQTLFRAPITVAAPGVGAIRYATLAAGGAGEIAIAYFGTTETGNPSSFPDTVTWNAYITFSENALAASPTFTTVSANDPADPVARGPCDRPTRCGNCNGNVCSGASVGDFLDLVIDGEGRPWYALVDMCVTECITDPTKARNGGNGALGTLAAGPSLRGAGTLSPLQE